MPHDPDHTERFGRLAGLLFVVGGLSSLLSLFAVGPGDAAKVLVVGGLAIATGVVALLVPWRRLPPAALHLVPVAGTLGAALAVSLIDVSLCWYFVFVTIWVALALPLRRDVALWVLLVSATLLALVADRGWAQPMVMQAAVGIPTLIITAAAVRWLRERLQAEHGALLALSRLDGLTGVGNYRALHEALGMTIARHRRSRSQFCLLLIDLDRFKQINEAHGHLRGDRVLHDVGHTLVGAVRDGDEVFRQGGDEFSVIAAETDEAGAAVLAGRIRAALSDILVDGEPVSASVAWSVFPIDGLGSEPLISAADAELMRSKHAGRRAAPRSVASAR